MAATALVQRREDDLIPSYTLGEYPENGHVRTVAVAIGPEFGTVGPELIREAAKEAVKVADLATARCVTL